MMEHTEYMEIPTGGVAAQWHRKPPSQLQRIPGRSQGPDCRYQDGREKLIMTVESMNIPIHSKNKRITAVITVDYR